jgi:hypothetical protein
MASGSTNYIFARPWMPIAGLCVFLIVAPALVNLVMVKWEP